jgi:hypothetical protein
MAKNIIKLELTKQDLNKYIYAIQSAIDMVDPHEFPLTSNDLIELKNKLTILK